MSAEIFNRISALEALVEALQAQVKELQEKVAGSQVCEEQWPTKPTLTLRKKADASHA
jgi:regulator of replication initiation timing